MPMPKSEGREPIPTDILDQPERIQFLMLQLRKYCTWLASRYDSPIWLVGSALHKDGPRDYDVRVIIPEARAHVMFGNGKPSNISVSGWHRRKLVEEARRGADMRRITSHEVDFQIQVGWQEAYIGAPRVQLDDWFAGKHVRETLTVTPIDEAPIDDEPLTEEDREAVEEGLADVAAGRDNFQRESVPEEKT